MGRGKQLPEFGIRAEAVVDPGGVDRPVAVIARKSGVGIDVLPPGVARILRHGGDPDRRHPQIVEESLLDLVGDALQVAAHVVHLGADVRTVQRRIVRRVPVLKTVDHQRVEHLGLRVVAVQLLRVADDPAVGERHQYVVVEPLLAGGIDAQAGALRLPGILRDDHPESPLDGDDPVVGQAAVLPHGDDPFGPLFGSHRHHLEHGPGSVHPARGIVFALQHDDREAPAPAPYVEGRQPQFVGSRNIEGAPVVGRSRHDDAVAARHGVGLLPAGIVVGQQDPLRILMQTKRIDRLSVAVGRYVPEKSRLTPREKHQTAAGKQ